MPDPSPLAALPAEILGCSFRFLLDGFTASTWQEVFPARKAGFNVAAVNRHFRAIALDTPRLWSILDLDFTSLARRPSVYKNYAEIVLTRSLQAPLHVHLTDLDAAACGEGPERQRLASQSKAPWPEIRKLQWSLYEAIIAQAHRWAVFRITFVTTTAPAISMLVNADMPLLHTLDIYSNDSNRSDILMTITEVDPIAHRLASKAPRLRRLFLALDLLNVDLPPAPRINLRNLNCGASMTNTQRGMHSTFCLDVAQC